MRVAAVQYAAGGDVGENLATTRRMIAEAVRSCEVDGGRAPDVVVCPEFANHYSWYDDHDHAVAVACEVGDAFFQGVAEAAASHGVWVMVNVTLHRPEVADGHLTGSNVLFDRTGAVAAITDKQVLMGAEGDHLSPGTTNAPIVPIDLMNGGTADTGMYSCMDGVIMETPRGLALRGGKVLLNSLNSFALDEASLHIPVRAAENRVFVVAANKVGPLIPPHAVAMVSEKMGVPESALHGAGESQIVAPDGTVLAIGPHTGEAVVFADINPALADVKAVHGTHVVEDRRPTIYGALADAPKGRTRPPGADTLAAIAYASHDAPLARACLDATEPTLFVLPEAAADTAVVPSVTDLTGWVSRAPEGSVIVTSIRDFGGAGRHDGIAVTSEGIVLRQSLLHPGRSWGGGPLGDAIVTVDLPWGRLAVVVGSDAIFPETFRLVALEQADVVAVPTIVQEPWEVRTGLVERAAENRLCLVAASPWSDAGGSLIADLYAEMQLWAPRSDRDFDGTINDPRVVRATGAEPIATTIHPAYAARRIITKNTDVVDSRPWELLDDLLRLY